MHVFIRKILLGHSLVNMAIAQRARDKSYYYPIVKCTTQVLWRNDDCMQSSFVLTALERVFTQHSHRSSKMKEAVQFPPFGSWYFLCLQGCCVHLLLYLPNTFKEYPEDPFQPHEITVNRFEMQDMLWRTIPSRKTKTHATNMTVQTPDHVELLTTPLLSCSSSPISCVIAPWSGCCSIGTVTTVTGFWWLPGSNLHPISPGNKALSLVTGRGHM